MNEAAKLYYVDESGLVEGEMLGRIGVYLVADYARLEQECEHKTLITGDYIAKCQQLQDECATLRDLRIADQSKIGRYADERDAALKQVEDLQKALNSILTMVVDARSLQGGEWDLS